MIPLTLEDEDLEDEDADDLEDEDAGDDEKEEQVADVVPAVPTSTCDSMIGPAFAQLPSIIPLTLSQPPRWSMYIWTSELV